MTSSQKSAWNVVDPTGGPNCLNDVMAEELVKEMHLHDEIATAKQLQDDETLAKQLQDPDSSDIIKESPTDVTEDDTDHVLAVMLQQQFDKEYDDSLRNQERKIYGNQKVRVTLSNHYRAETSGAPCSDSEDDDYDPPERKLASGPERAFNRSGYSGKGSNMKTKHDPDISARKHADKMSEFGVSFNTGDTDGMGVKLNNRVFNSLKVHAFHEEKRLARLHEKKEHSTAEMAVDQKTRNILYKMVNNGRLADVTGVVATGKESVVLHANCGEEAKTLDGRKLPAEAAVKVFKTTLNEFKTRSIYVKGDFRFSKLGDKKHSLKKIMGIWCEKELLNLMKMLHHRLPCPEPLFLKQHVLVMQFIGENGVGAPRLKDAKLSSCDLEDAYQQTLRILESMFDNCQLVHADFSEYNLLWFKDTVWVIDVSQAVDRTHPHALEFLRRDCENIATFFSKKGVHDVMPWESLFNHIAHLHIAGEKDEFLKNFADFLSAQQDYEKDSIHLDHGIERKEYQFDHFFNSSDYRLISDDDNCDEDEDEDEGEASETEDETQTKVNEFFD